jgi:hypothetical protein
MNEFYGNTTKYFHYPSFDVPGINRTWSACALALPLLIYLFQNSGGLFSTEFGRPRDARPKTLGFRRLSKSYTDDKNNHGHCTTMRSPTATGPILPSQ